MRSLSSGAHSRDPLARNDAKFIFVIPGRDKVASPESITTIVNMDSGPAPSSVSGNDAHLLMRAAAAHRFVACALRRNLSMDL
jgi:hypothetical protein